MSPRRRRRWVRSRDPDEDTLNIAYRYAGTQSRAPEWDATNRSLRDIQGDFERLKAFYEKLEKVLPYARLKGQIGEVQKKIDENVRQADAEPLGWFPSRASVMQARQRDDEVGALRDELSRLERSLDRERWDLLYRDGPDVWAFAKERLSLEPLEVEKRVAVCRAALSRLPDLLSVGEVRQAEESQKRVEAAGLREERAARVAERAARVAERRRLVKAAANAHFGRARATAAEVKQIIRSQRELLDGCPYCGGSLGQDPHADHIYPIAKGGLSVEMNMVYVCSACNLRKGDLTLREFIKLAGLDRDRVEANLDLLKKRY